MQFDARLKTQNFSIPNTHKTVYCWKRGGGVYDVGINGTSHHYRCHSTQETEQKIAELQSLKIVF